MCCSTAQLSAAPCTTVGIACAPRRRRVPYTKQPRGRTLRCTVGDAGPPLLFAMAAAGGGRFTGDGGGVVIGIRVLFPKEGHPSLAWDSRAIGMARLIVTLAL